MGRKPRDLTGQRFGRLTPIKICDKDKEGRPIWLCKCDCGNECKVKRGNLTSGATKSCGCLSKEIHSNNMKLVNKKQWNNEEFIEMQRLKCSKQMTEYYGSIKDTEEYERIKKERATKAKERWKDEEYREAHSGKNHYRYNPNLTDEEREEEASIRKNNPNFKKWSKEVKEQADYTCDCCGKRGGKLCSHHLNCWNTYKEQRYELENGVCLCESCHKEFHKWMGGTNTECTKEDYINFKSNKK